MNTENLSPIYPRLTPRLSPWMHSVLDNRAQLDALFRQHHSPLNIHHMGPFGDNHRAYVEVLESHGLRHLVFFARKANKCRAFVGKAQRLGFGVDTASYRELQQCLEMGFEPSRLVLTAAIKDERLVRLAVQHNVPIMLDNLDECRLVERVAREMGKTQPVGVRISGFCVEGQQLYSRFGFELKSAVPLIAERMGAGREFHALRFRGLHFHLNGYSRQQRGAALHQSIDAADALRERGIPTHFIDMGGGFLVNYLEHESEWNTFHQQLRRAMRGERPPITFGNNGLGLEMVDGELHGEPNVYPYYNDTPKERFLDEVLACRDESGETAAARLRERDIELRMEPGRSLLDQTGITVARVAFRKRDSRGDLLVGLEMNRTQMFSSSADFLLDPIVVSQRKAPYGAYATAGYFVGAYCLEQDVILKRKINLTHVPDIGDYVCFPNTAGYMMHFYESEAHLFELATNLIAVPGANGAGAYEFIEDALVGERMTARG